MCTWPSGLSRATTPTSPRFLNLHGIKSMNVPKIKYEFWKQSFSWAFLLYQARFLKIFSFLKMQNIEHRRMKKFLVIRVTWILKARLYKYFFSSELLNKIFLEDTKLSFFDVFSFFFKFRILRRLRWLTDYSILKIRSWKVLKRNILGGRQNETWIYN